MSVPTFTSKDEFDEVINSGEVVVIDFTATWCGPCKMISPVFEQHSQSEKFPGVKFYKVDVDELPDISKEVGVRAMPTFMVFKSGQKVNELVGASPAKLEEILLEGAALVA